MFLKLNLCKIILFEKKFIYYLMQPLNLPPFEYNFKTVEDKIYIFDIIRKKYLLNTPEEWVRQHFVHFLINQRNYSKNLIKLETGLNYGHKRKRTDIQVFDNDGMLQILVECKAPNIKISKSTISQILQYNKVLNPKFLVISNGIEHVIIGNISNSTFDFFKDLPENTLG